jgi:hypothetical protein
MDLFRRAISSSYSASHVGGGPKRVRLLTTTTFLGRLLRISLHPLPNDEDAYDDDIGRRLVARVHSDDDATASCRCLTSMHDDRRFAEDTAARDISKQPRGRGSTQQPTVPAQK